MAGLAATAALPRVHSRQLSALSARSAGRLRQSVSRWCYARIPLDDLCAAAKEIGLVAIDLLDEKDWPVPKQHGLACAMANGFLSSPLPFNPPELHPKLGAAGGGGMPRAAA